MRVHKELFERWNKYAALYLREHALPAGTVSPVDLTNSVQAWQVAHRLDIPREAYALGLNDSHIETALRRIFPNAFKPR